MPTVSVRDARAGPAVDAACARVRGWRQDGWAWMDKQGEFMGYATKAPDWYGVSERRWQPSIDIALAWELVEAMDERHIKIEKHAFYKPPAWIVKVEGACSVTARSLPLGIACAFLLAHGVTEIEVDDDDGSE